MNHLAYLLSRVSLWVLLLVALTACDSSDSIDDDVPGDGESSMALSGQLSKSTPNARAVFATGADIENGSTPGVAFVLYQTTATDTTWLVLASEGSNTLPAVGTYSFYDITEEDPENASAYTALYYSANASSTTLAYATSGTLRIQRSETGRIDGTVEFDGTGWELTPSLAGSVLKNGRVRPFVPDVSKFNPQPKDVSMRASFKAPRASKERIAALIEELNLLDAEVPGTPVNQGSASFTVENESRTLSYEGFSVFGATEGATGSDEEAFAVALYVDGSESDGAVLLLVRVGTSNRPAPGEYRISSLAGETEPTDGDFIALLIDAAQELSLISVDGTVTISSSTSERLSGTLSFGAADALSGNPDVAYDIVGAFSAVNGDLPGVASTMQ